MRQRPLKTPQERIDSINFSCSCCGGDKQGMMALYKPLPDSIFAIPEDERAGRAQIGSDLCILDAEHFFVRAVLYLPILETNETFEFGVWGTLSRENFEKYREEYNNPTPTFGPFFSWLNSDLPPYPDTFNLPCDLEFRAGNLRPAVHPHPGEHPLVADHCKGLTVDRLSEIYSAWGHSVLL